MIISVSPSIRVAKMQARELTLDSFLAMFAPANVKEQSRKDGPNYIAGQLLDYTKPRGKGNVINRSAVVLDCDDADRAGMEALCAAVKGLGSLAIVHSTYSSTPEAPRARVVIPLVSPVVPGDYRDLCRALMAHLSMVKWDESCDQAERAMYMPAKPVRGQYWAVCGEGPCMDGLGWLKAHAPASKARNSKGNVAKRDKKRRPREDAGIQGAFNRVYSIEDAIEAFDLPYEPCRDGRWTLYGAHAEGGLRLVEGREDLCISEHANSDPAHFVDGNGSLRALSAFELCAVHLYGEADDTSVRPGERASVQAMAKRAAEDEAVRAELGALDMGGSDVSWIREASQHTRVQAVHVADELRDELAYVDGIGWLLYSAGRGVWEASSESAVINRVAEITEAWHMAATMTGDEALTKKAKPLCSLRGVRAILAHLLAMVSLSADDFDADPDLLCVKNGVIDLRTGELREHGPQYRMMRQAAAAYREGAAHGAWDKALECLNARERTWLQTWFGCGCTGHQPRDREAGVPILSGGGANGKSLLATGVIRALGTYARAGSHALLMPENGASFAHAAVSLKGARLVIVEELPDGVLSGNAVKMLVGTPTMVAEAKYQMPFEFKVTHSLAITANVLPRLDESTDGVNRRLAVLKFPYRYVPNPRAGSGERQIDTSLDVAVETPEVQEAVLAWLVAGARRYYEAGQHVQAPTESMRAAKACWLSNVDTLAGFFADMLVEDADAMIPWTHLYAAFADWQRENGGKAWNKATFKNRVASHRLFADMQSGRLRTTGMSCYQPVDLAMGPVAPSGTQVAGLRGVRFRRPSDDVEPEPMVEAPAENALIPAEDVGLEVPVVPEARVEHERSRAVDKIQELVSAVCQVAESHEAGMAIVDRLTRETGCVGTEATLGQLRAFRIRLEGELSRMRR